MEDKSKEPLIKSMWHELYVELMASPLDQRTDKEFCEENKLHPNTLSHWKRIHRVALFNEVQRRRVLYLNEMRALAYKQLNTLCKKDVNAIKLMFQLTGDLVEQTKTTHEFMSRQDKIDRINALLREANAKSETWKKVQESQGTTDAVPGPVDERNEQHGDGPGKDTP